LFETVRTADRENLFKWVGPTQIYDISLYGLKSVLRDKRHSNQLPGDLTSCAYRNSAIIVDLNRLGFVEGNNLSITANSGDCIEMVLKKRVDVMAITELGKRQLEPKAEAQGDSLVKVRVMEQRKRYLAFSKDVSDARIARWQQALEQSYLDGTMRRTFQHVYPPETMERLENFARQQQVNNEAKPVQISTPEKNP
jgi:polar amino acid transport system substrate-binding protein